MVDPALAPSDWNPLRRLWFRFIFAFWLLVCVPVPEGLAGLPFDIYIDQPVLAFWNKLVPWVGAHLLHLKAPLERVETGSGDTLYFYVKLLTIVILALVTTGLWTAFDRRARSYPRLQAGLRVYLRYILALALFGYGFAKVFPLQFPLPSEARLAQSYGESSPMGLLWTFMGASPAYTMFAGATEVLAALLVLFRRTTALGALVATGVMTNVVMLNFCYDVPVKLGSSLLLAMALFLLAPDIGRLADLLIFHRPTQPRPLGPDLPRPWMRRAYGVAKAIVVVGLLVMNIRSSWMGWNEYGGGAPSTGFAGGYEVERQIVKGVEVPPLLTETGRWLHAYVYRSAFIQFRRQRAEALRFPMQDDTVTHTLTLFSPEKPASGKPVPVGSLRYRWADATHLILEGTLHGDALEVHLRKLDRGSFLLHRRGFHWVQESPFNR